MEESSIDNPAESEVDVTTTAEEGLPENPEIVQSSAVELSQEDKSTTEEITEELAEEITEEIKEEIKEEITEESNGATEESNGATEESNGTTEESNGATEEPNEKPEVHFAPGHTSISYVPEEEEDTVSVISLLLEEFTGHFLARLPRILSLEEQLPVEMVDKFTQTFYKAMTKLSKRRFVEIINIEVDHDDPTLVFFCPSYELLTSFKENNEDSVET